MGNVSRGRGLLVLVLGAYLAAMGWLWLRFPPADFGKGVILVGAWVVLPVVLALLAGGGAGWARRGLAVVWGLHGVLQFLWAQKVSAELSQGGQGVTLEEAITSAAVSVVCVLAAAVVVVQRDIREMTRPR